MEGFTQFIHKMAGQESQMCRKQPNKNGNGYTEPGQLSNSICAYEFLIKDKEKPSRAKGIIDGGRSGQRAWDQVLEELNKQRF